MNDTLSTINIYRLQYNLKRKIVSMNVKSVFTVHENRIN